MNAILEQAQWLASRGIFVNTLKPGTKALVDTGPVLAMATRDADEIERRFAGSNYNLGVVTGQDSNLVVLDIDTKHNSRGREALAALEDKCGPLPPTLHETTASGGGHLYFKLDGFDVPNGKLIVEGITGMEVFGRPHNVVAAPSVLNDNGTLKPYKIVNLIEPVTLPTTICEYVLSHYDIRNKVGGKISAGEGRNNAMFSEACALRGRATPADQAWQMLRAKNEQQCDPPLNDGELRKLFDSAWKYIPTFANTELGNARRLVNRFGQDLRYIPNDGFYTFTDERGHWLQDKESLQVTKWAKQTIDDIHADAIKLNDAGRSDEGKKSFAWAGASQATHHIEATLRSARSEGIDVKGDLFDSNLMLAGVTNGVIDLATGSFRKSSREDYISKTLGCKYNSAAKPKLWLEFLKRATDGDSKYTSYLQRAMGYSLTGRTDERCFFFAHGGGGNGKSVIIEIVKAISGDYGRNMRTETLMAHTRRSKGGASEDEARLAGARVVTVNETEAGQRFDAALIKDLTGNGDTITARHLHKASFEFIPRFKLWMRGNHKPAFSGDDEAMASRLRLLPFLVRIPVHEQNKLLIEILKATELPGILNWMIVGCLDWVDHGLGEPENVLRATREYVADEDVVGKFIDECCEPMEKTTESTTPLSKLWDRFEYWSRANGGDLKVLDSRSLSAKLILKGCTKGTRGKTGVTLKGIKLIASTGGAASGQGDLYEY